MTFSLPSFALGVLDTAGLLAAAFLVRQWVRLRRDRERTLLLEVVAGYWNFRARHHGPSAREFHFDLPWRATDADRVAVVQAMMPFAETGMVFREWRRKRGSRFELVEAETGNESGDKRERTKT